MFNDRPPKTDRSDDSQAGETRKKPTTKPLVVVVSDICPAREGSEIHNIISIHLVYLTFMSAGSLQPPRKRRVVLVLIDCFQQCHRPSFPTLQLQSPSCLVEPT